MPRFSLRTLVIVLALGPPLLWWSHSAYVEWKARQERKKIDWTAAIQAAQNIVDGSGAVLTDDDNLELGGLIEIPVDQPDVDSSHPTTTSPPIPK